MNNNMEKNSRGVIAWMVHNRVTPNLLMLVLLVGGLFMTTKIKQEVFPEFELDRVSVRVSYPGASPDEVEQSVVLAIERALEGIVGIKEVSGTASEGSGTVDAELEDGADGQLVLQDIEQQVGTISTFPVDAEDPKITLASHRRQVIRLNLFGDVSEAEMRSTVEQVKDQLLLSDGISQVDITGARDYEISIDIPMANLRRYGLTLDSVAQSIKASAIDVPGGKVDAQSGEILLRLVNRKFTEDEFYHIPVISGSDGIVYLGDIATIKEGFEQSSRLTTYNGKFSMQLKIFRVGEQTPIGVSEAAYKAMESIEKTLPPSISWDFTSDSSKVYKQRLDLLLKNAFIGLVLVLVLLAVFLDFRLAFWVTMGIPISFLGGLLFLPAAGVSINMISLFAFIVSLGIVVDDAIIAGENIYEYRQRGMDNLEAAIEGAKDVAVPIGFSIMTNIVAFLPLYFVPGIMGKVWKAIPMVVICVFIISWVESILILPTHLAHSKSAGKSKLSLFLEKIRQRVTNGLNGFVQKIYSPFLCRLLDVKLLTISALLVILIITWAWVSSGRIGFILMPRVESDRAVVTATLPYGSPLADVKNVRDKLVKGAEAVADKYEKGELVEGISAHISENIVEVNAYLTPAGVRPLSTKEVTKMWRQETGVILGLESLRFESDRGGPGSGAGLTVELSHRDNAVLDEASLSLAAELENFPAVKDADNGQAQGKLQYDFTINERGAGLGLTAAEVGRQVRNGFQGVIALRQQRANNEITMRVRLPDSEREGESDIEGFLIHTRDNVFVPLMDVTNVKVARAYTSIKRRDGRRTARVSANVDPIGQTSQITATLKKEILPELSQKFPGLSYSFQGRQANRKESVGGLGKNFAFALVGMYFLLAIPFRSYSQPLVVMMAIPFGMVGAVMGHVLMGYNLSLMSMMGIVALSGIVVNDSLVLIDYANKQQAKGERPRDAILAAGRRRFRPVLLTTLTTFGGLAPMIFETSRQARFMIPMAISLGFGVIFATVVTLILVPCLYLIVEDTREFVKGGVAQAPRS